MCLAACVCLGLVVSIRLGHYRQRLILREGAKAIAKAAKLLIIANLRFIAPQRTKLSYGRS